MIAPSQYAVLVTAGLFTGVAVHRLSRTRRTTLVRLLIESIGVLPGVFLIGFAVGQTRASRSPVDLLWATGAFFVPHALVRFAAYRAGASSRVRREQALPFVHWFDLMQTNARAAEDFLAAYLAQRRRRVGVVGELQAACASLEETYAGNPFLSVALDTLRGEIARLGRAS